MATDHKKAFIKLFLETARYHHRYKVFRDFVTMSAISFQNSIIKCDKLEQEYLDIIGQYERQDQLRMPKLLAELVEGLEAHYSDFLGSVFMELELFEDKMGQFFTPYHLSKLMAKLTHGSNLSSLMASREFITVSEPACGSGGMVLAFAEVMREEGFNPQTQMWAHCIDVDEVVAYMCYLQLSLFHIPAEVTIGNALSMKFRRTLKTPAHYLGFWDSKLERMNEPYKTQEKITKPTQAESIEVEGKPKRQALKRPLLDQLALFDLEL